MAREVEEDTDTEHLFKRGDVWYVRRVQDGKRLIQTTGETNLKRARLERDRILNPYNLRDEKERAEAVLSRVSNLDQQLAVIEDSKPATAIMHGWQAYIDQHNRPDTGPATLEVYEGQYEAFARWMGAEHPEAAELRQVTQDHADRYAGHLLKKVSPSTFNRHIVLLALVWRVLEKPARLSVNPWKGIERKRFTVHSRRELTIEELWKVFNTATGEMRLLLALGTFCGLRLGDAACLGWDEVDMLKGVISLIPQKTARRAQKRVTLPIHRTLFTLLNQTPAAQRKGYVLPNMEKRYNSFDGALAKDVGRVFQGCGIETKGKDKGAKRASAACGFHSLRHTFVSLCAAGGVSQSVVQSLVGHGSPAMTQHYTHIAIETAKRAVALLPDVTHTTATAKPADATQAPDTSLLAIVEGMTVKTWRADRARLLEMLKPEGTPKGET